MNKITNWRKAERTGCADRAKGARRIATLLVGAALLADPAFAQQLAEDCGSLDNAYGPFDYTNPANATRQPGKGASPLELVESGHFTAKVENLVSGISSVNPLDDLEYTLRAFPNHHRALNAMANYHLRNGLRKHGRYSIDCWFDRAIRFRPDDPVVRLVYGIFLAKKGSRQEAVDQYEEALRLGNEMPEAHYNLGLLYTDMKEYELALEHAKRAYELGFPLPGLRNRLIAANVWQTESRE